MYLWKHLYNFLSTFYIANLVSSSIHVLRFRISIYGHSIFIKGLITTHHKKYVIFWIYYKRVFLSLIFHCSRMKLKHNIAVYNFPFYKISRYQTLNICLIIALTNLPLKSRPTIRKILNFSVFCIYICVYVYMTIPKKKI